MEADDRQALGRRPPQGLAPELERAAHDDQIDPRRRQGLVEVVAHRECRRSRSPANPG